MAVGSPHERGSYFVGYTPRSVRFFPCRGLRLTDVDRRGIERALDMRSVEFLDHLDAGPAIFSDLIDVCPLHQPQAYICVPEAVGRSRIAVAVELQFGAGEQIVEEFDVIAREHLVQGFREDRGRFRRCFTAFPAPLLSSAATFAFDGLGSVEESLIGDNGARHALAVADASFAPHLDFEDPFACRIVLDDFDVSMFEIFGFVGTKAGVGHEQDIVMHLFGVPSVIFAKGLLRVGAGRLIELLVFGWAEPWPMLYFCLLAIGGREVGKMV